MEIAQDVPIYTSRPKDRPFDRRPAGWYLIDFARSRHTNPACIPVSVNADWYYPSSATNRCYQKIANHYGAAPSAPAANASVAAAESAVL